MLDKNQFCSYFRPYIGVGRVFLRYWTVYGGWRALLSSPYLHVALLAAVVAHPRWLSTSWPEDVLAVLPSVLGFSLGGYAMLLAFGDTKFLKFLASPGRNASSYLNNVSSSFVHFIVVQILSILLTLMLSGYLNNHQSWIISAASGLVYWTYLYALFTALAATFAVFRMTSLYAKYAPKSDNI